MGTDNFPILHCSALCKLCQLHLVTIFDSADASPPYSQHALRKFSIRPQRMPARLWVAEYRQPLHGHSFS